MTDANRMEMARRRQREQLEIEKAKSEGKSRSYVDNDGCEVTVTPSGEVFYNVADWW